MTKTIVRSFSNEAIDEAAAIIRAGGLVAFPTETVYGLGANALDPQAARKIYAAKGRPSDNPLIVHVATEEDAERCAELTETARDLINNFWPGPLTVVARSRDVVPNDTRGGLNTVALRMPDDERALALIARSSVPIAAPSANRSGRPSPTTASAVLEDLDGAVDMIIDGGATIRGVESTVVDTTTGSAVILRNGALAAEDIERVVKLSEIEACDVRRSPGTRYRHYAPQVPLIAWDRAETSAPVIDPAKRSVFIGLGEPPSDLRSPISLYIFNDVENYARGLFSAMRSAEHEGDLIVAELPDISGIGAALRDRIIRAAGAK